MKPINFPLPLQIGGLFKALYTKGVIVPYETDERLKSYLDTNQLHREQMCRAVLAVDKRYSDVRPRHPVNVSEGCPRPLYGLIALALTEQHATHPHAPEG